MKLPAYTYLLLLLCSLAACGQQPKTKAEPAAQNAQPKHYDLARPKVFAMPGVLDEISGIAFHNGDGDTVYAEQDEEGKLFYFRLGDDTIGETKFGRKGDYEDVQVCNNYILMLRSDGVLFIFPLEEAGNNEAGHVQEFKKLLPPGEYEGMYADETSKSIYVLCKHCNEKMSAVNSGYILSVSNTGRLNYTGSFTIDVTAIAAKMGGKKINFQPSALAKNNTTNEWYVVSSVNKLLVVTDAGWKIKEVYPLDPSLFNQPEGIAFDGAGNLYISNEKGNTKHATILKLPYKQ